MTSSELSAQVAGTGLPGVGGPPFANAAAAGLTRRLPGPQGEGGRLLRSPREPRLGDTPQNIENNPMHSSGMIDTTFPRAHFDTSRLSKYSIEVRRRRKSFDDDGGDAEKIPSSVQYEPLSRTVFCELDWVPNTCSASSGKSPAIFHRQPPMTLPGSGLFGAIAGRHP